MEATKRTFAFPKSARILKSSDFRRVYDTGTRVSGPLFAAFCLRMESERPARVGFTVPRAVGKATARNRIKRRMREAVRRKLPELEPRWEIVINPRRAALEAEFSDIEQEVAKLFSRCKG